MKCIDLTSYECKMKSLQTLLMQLKLHKILSNKTHALRVTTLHQSKLQIFYNIHRYLVFSLDSAHIYHPIQILSCKQQFQMMRGIATISILGIQSQAIISLFEQHRCVIKMLLLGFLTFYIFSTNCNCNLLQSFDNKFHLK